MILAIDPSLVSTGVCVMADDGQIELYKTIKTKKDGDNYYERVNHICNEIFHTPVDLLEGTDFVIENQYLGVSPKVYGDLCGLRAAIVNTMRFDMYSFQEYQPAEWRKIVDLKKQKGEDWKQLAVDFVNEKYNLELKYSENDIADAILIALARKIELDKLKEKE